MRAPPPAWPPPRARGRNETPFPERAAPRRADDVIPAYAWLFLRDADGEDSEERGLLQVRMGAALARPVDEYFLDEFGRSDAFVVNEDGYRVVFDESVVEDLAVAPFVDVHLFYTFGACRLRPRVFRSFSHAERAAERHWVSVVPLDAAEGTWPRPLAVDPRAAPRETAARILAFAERSFGRTFAAVVNAAGTPVLPGPGRTSSHLFADRPTIVLFVA